MDRAHKRVTRRTLLLGSCGAATLARAGKDAERPATPRRFDPERFVADCVAAAQRDPATSQQAIRELMEGAFSAPGAVLTGVGAPVKGGLRALHRSADLTILNIAWSPLMQLLPHEHNMWALIGIYGGREDNIFWKRTPAGIAATGARAISAGDVVELPHDVIHSVSNPIEKLTGAIHVYGGDFFEVHRSEWDPETLRERDWSIREAVRNFEASNARFFDCRHM
jgi:predicted metal-dependent enzyme (double-stranded beta helix superfamily)